MQDLAAGGLDFTTNSVVEARAMLDAGRARSLAVMAGERLGVFPNIPTLQEATGVDYRIGAWRGIAGPKGVPAEIVTTLGAALDRTFKSKDYQDFLTARGFGLVYADPAGFGKHLAEADKSLGDAMKAAGLAKG
jgi:tripartite-type tricarboxylate transporter receptor subunit TctC